MDNPEMFTLYDEDGNGAQFVELFNFDLDDGSQSYIVYGLLTKVMQAILNYYHLDMIRMLMQQMLCQKLKQIPNLRWLKKL
ncbi:Uncharacterised protein [Weissella viridescens]|uniref:Uncharacterized protein n=1 Tax=Weissella viridescens TaxID=1629 RepID=A0A380P1M2_WEIVI|nr:Uncharacterised protein [Weissella viridescens]